jgi:hypothetical protein
LNPGVLVPNNDDGEVTTGAAVVLSVRPALSRLRTASVKSFSPLL